MANTTDNPTPDDIAANADLSGQISALKSDIARLSETVARLVESEIAVGKAKVRHAVEGATERMRETVETVRERGAEFVGGATENARKHYHDLEQSIERNPLAAVGIAAGIGFIIGLMHRGNGR